MNKRLLASLVGSVGAVLVVATASFAAVTTNVQVPFSGVVPNSCTGELMSADIVDHVVASATVNGNRVSLSYHVNEDGSMTGLTSGVKYQIAAVQNAHLNFGPTATSESAELRFRINGQGSTPDLVQTGTLKFTVNAKGTVTVARGPSLTLTCG
jgi:hypothetical protein